MNWFFILRALAARKLRKLLSFRLNAAAGQPVIHPSRHKATNAQESSRERSKAIYFSNHWLLLLRGVPREKLHFRIEFVRNGEAIKRKVYPLRF